MKKVFALAAVIFAFEDNLAVDEMVNNIEQDGTLRTGALWGGVWTRDVSYSAILSLSYMVPSGDMIAESLDAVL